MAGRLRLASRPVSRARRGNDRTAPVNGNAMRSHVRWALGWGAVTARYAALVLALLLALSTGTGSLLGPAKQFAAASPEPAAALLVDDAGDGVFAVMSQLPLVVALVVALALVCIAHAAPAEARVTEPRRARAPPSR